jgi:uncharacterized delta-60 repeat protein
MILLHPLLVTFLSLVLAACGRFDFSSRVAFQANIAEARFLTIDPPSDLGLGGCSPITIKAWSAPSVIGGIPAGTTLKLEGLRAGDQVFADPNCRQSLDVTALPASFAAISATYYVRSASMGTYTLEVSSARFAAVTQTAGVKLVPTSLSYTVPSTTFSVGAGLCYGPVGFQVRDANRNPIAAASQEVQIQNGEGLVYSDSNCANAIPAATLKLTNASVGAFYLKRGSVASAQVALTIKDPKQGFISADTINVGFGSVPFQIRIVAGSGYPGRTTLGLCQAVPFTVELRDVDGNLTSPVAGTTLNVLLSTTSGSVATYRNGCGGMSSEVTSLSFSPGETNKPVYVEARSRNTTVLRAFVVSSPIQAGVLSLTVDTLPTALVLMGPDSVVAGSVTSAFSVTLVDGLGSAISAPASGVNVQLAGSAVSNGKVCATSACPQSELTSAVLSIPSGAFQAAFYYRPSVNLPTGSQSISASALNLAVSGDSRNILVNLRVPLRVAISAGPGNSTVDLGLCQATAFSIDLLDGEGLPVAPAAGVNLSVGLSYSVGSGNIRTASCSGSVVNSVTFAPGEQSKLVYITALASPAVTLLASANGLTSGSKALTVNRVPVSLRLSSVPSSLVAGMVNNPAMVVSVLDGIGNAIAAPSGGITVQFSGTAASVGVFCSSASCPASALSQSRILVPAGANQIAFYYRADPNTLTSSRTVIASSGTLVSDTATIGITTRVPVQMSFSGGPVGVPVVLGVCYSVPFSVNLLDSNGLAVSPAAGTQLVVALDFSVGDGEFQTSCGGSAISSLVFNPGETTKNFHLVATASPSVTLRGTATGLAAITRQVSVERRALYLAVLGPAQIDAGKPAGPFRVVVMDGVKQPMAIGGSGVSGILSVPAAARASYCAASDCAVRTNSLTVSISSSQSESAFFLFSDADSSLSGQSLSVSPSLGSLTTLPLSLGVVRRSLTLDTGYGTQGRSTLSGLSYDRGEVMGAAYLNGKHVLAGYQVTSGVRRAAVARLLASGDRDTSFSGNGILEIALGDSATAVAVVAQGSSYLVAGTVETTALGVTNKDIFVARLSNSGALDTSFRHVSGVLDPVSLPGDQMARTLVLGTDGTIYVVGSSEGSAPSDFFVAAFAADGAVRQNESYDFGAGVEIASAAHLQNSAGQDKLVIGGTAGVDGNRDFLIARVLGVRGSSTNEVLTLDTSFGVQGSVRLNLSQADVLRSLAVHPSGNRLLAVGSSREASSPVISLVALTSDGNAIGSFGNQGGFSLIDVAGSASDRAYACAVDARTGSIYLSGSADNDALVARVNDQGTSDGLSPSQARFTLPGSMANREAFPVVLGPDAKPLVATSQYGAWQVLGLLR